jgi:hypothetical protein
MGDDTVGAALFNANDAVFACARACNRARIEAMRCTPRACEWHAELDNSEGGVGHCRRAVGAVGSRCVDCELDWPDVIEESTVVFVRDSRRNASI